MAESRSIKNVEIFAPRVRVHFHTEDGAFEVATKDSPGGQEQSLVACQTYKDIGQPTGSFMVHLADFGRYDKLLKPMDLVTISMSNHTPFAPSTGNLSFNRDQLTHATMIGFIDSVRRKRLIDPTTGKPNIFCEIKGRDFGKLMVKHQIRYLPWLLGGIEGERMLSPVVAMFKSLLSGFMTGGTVDFLVANNFRKMFAESVKMTVSFEKRQLEIQNSFSFRAQKELGIIPYNLPVMGQEGSFWQVLGNFANLPFNEMWVDTINNPKRVIDDSEASPLSSPLTSDELGDKRAKAKDYIAKQTSSDKEQSTKNFGANGEKISTAEKYGGENNAYTMLFLRRTPFDKDDWKAVPRIFISNSDIQEQDLGVSDHEVYNYFVTYPLLPIPNDLTLKGIGVLPLLTTRQRQFSEKPGAGGYPSAIVLSNADGGAAASGDDARRHAKIARRNAVEKFGYLPMEQRTRVWLNSSAGKMNNVARTANLLTLTLANWYKHNSVLKSGAMTIKGLPDMHVGNVLVNVDEGEEYYVEGVANNYVQYQPMTTTVMVTRGQRIGEIEWGNAYREFCKTAPLPVGSQDEAVPQ